MKKITIAIRIGLVFEVDENLPREEQIAQRVNGHWHQWGFGRWNDADTWSQAEREVAEWHEKRLERN
jgi:hypothetical protein